MRERRQRKGRSERKLEETAEDFWIKLSTEQQKQSQTHTFILLNYSLNTTRKNNLALAHTRTLTLAHY